ncbi:GNAT family N-acetyltransferase, partial [Thiolapillus sp.]
PRSEAYFVFPLAQGTPGKQCGLAATGVYQPSLRSPWLAARETLIPALTDQPGAFSILAFDGDEPVGLVNCFQTLSTFKARPLINIHDVTVKASHRGQGISTRMLREVEAVARQRGCCKLTLEVLEGNRIAQQVYRKFGFNSYELDPALGQALFWEKKLPD